jgi:hypothetical protein
MTAEYNNGLFFRGFIPTHIGSIPGFLKNLDWRNPNAPQIAQTIINRHLENVFTNVRIIACDYGLDSTTTWCNLLAECYPDDVQWLWLAVVYSDLRGESIFGTRQVVAQQQLPRPDDMVSCLLSLVNGAPRLNWRQVELLVPKQKAAVFSAHVRDVEKEYSKTSNSFMHKILSGAMEVFGENNTERVLASVAKIVNAYDVYTGLSTTQFLDLPSPISGAISYSSRYREVFLDATTIVELDERQASARQYGLRKAYPRRGDWARAIIRSKLDSPAVIQGLEYWGIDLPALTAAIKKCRSPQPSTKLLEWLSQQPKNEVLNALEVLASPVQDRLNLLKGHPAPVRAAADMSSTRSGEFGIIGTLRNRPSSFR